MEKSFESFKKQVIENYEEYLKEENLSNNKSSVEDFILDFHNAILLDNSPKEDIEQARKIENTIRQILIDYIKE